MDKLHNILNVFNEPLTWTAIAVIVGIIGKRVADEWKGLVYFLCTAIEKYDSEIADVIPAEMQTKFETVKKIVKKTVPAEMQARLDKMLAEMGLLNKSMNGGYIYKCEKPKGGS